MLQDSTTLHTIIRHSTIVYKIVQNSSTLHKSFRIFTTLYNALQDFTNLCKFVYTGLQHIYKILQPFFSKKNNKFYNKCTKRYKTLYTTIHNCTTLYNALQHFRRFNTILHTYAQFFSQLYIFHCTLHNSTQLYTTSQNYTTLYKKNKLHTTSHILTKILHNFTPLF